ncbi:hypothetical protein [Mesorhizobium sp. M0220]|uniref:hypothetical protein n=1 Tax=unclassified Mesorhizobium TaxID=325217 RepID=UPI00333620F3
MMCSITPIGIGGAAPMNEIENDFRHQQLNLACPNEGLERADDGLLPIILGDVQPDARVYENPEHRIRPPSGSVDV